MVFIFSFIKKLKIIISLNKRLPYSQQKRRVIFEKEVESRKAEKNLIIQWDQPKINYKTSVNWVGVENADPIAYKKKYGNNLTAKSKLPDYVKELDKESGFEEYCNEILRNNQELEGDIEALKYVDLDKEGLSKYKKYVDKRKDLLLTTSLQNKRQYRERNEFTKKLFIKIYIFTFKIN